MGAGASNYNGHTGTELFNCRERSYSSSGDSGDARPLTHWCYQCEARVQINEQQDCQTCSGGFVEQIGTARLSRPDALSGESVMSALAAQQTALRVALEVANRDESGRTPPSALPRPSGFFLARSSGGQTITTEIPMSSEIRMEELLRDLQSHLRMAEEIRNAMRVAVGQSQAGARELDPAGPAVWRSIKSLSEEQVSKIIVDSQGESQCVICCADYVDGAEEQTLCELPGCLHIFHKQCLEQWLDRASNCPICRGDLKAAAKAAEPDDEQSVITENESKSE